MQAMSSAFALLLVLPMVVSGLEVYISNPATKTIAASSTQLTFTFTESVTDFSSDDVSIRGGAATKGRLSPVSMDGAAFAYNRWTLTISDLQDARSYTVTVPSTSATSCRISNGGCTSAAGAQTNSASAPFTFNTALTPTSPMLSTQSPGTVTNGGMAATEVVYTLTFPTDVYVGAQGHQIFATDSRGEDLDIFVRELGLRTWTYSVVGENGDSITTGCGAAGAVDKTGRPTGASNPASLTTRLNVRMDCQARDVWSEWTTCANGRQSHTSNPIVAVEAFNGGMPCTLTPKSVSRDCVSPPSTHSCAARGPAACGSFNAGDACDCTPDCLSQANGVGCCPDVGTTCGLGCAEAGCDVMIVDYEQEIVCTCDYECLNHDDCCGDFEAQCSGSLCGFKVIKGDVSKGEMCSDTYSDQDDNLPCFCDSTCPEYGDCCSDYFRICDNPSTCKQNTPDDGFWSNCGKTYQDCGCDILCPYYDDCCLDYGITCAYSSELPPVHTFVQFTAKQVDNKYEHDANPNPPPELCNCVASGLSEEDCCGSQVGFFGRRCSCSNDCAQYEDCCPDYASVC